MCAAWGAACETAFWPEGTVSKTLNGNRRSASASVTSADPVAQAVMSFAEKLGRGEIWDPATQQKGAPADKWTGTATSLLSLLAGCADTQTRSSKAWPGGPNVLSGRLSYLKQALADHGVEVTRSRDGHARDRTITVCAKVEVTPVGSSATSAEEKVNVDQYVSADDRYRPPIVARTIPSADRPQYRPHATH